MLPSFFSPAFAAGVFGLALSAVAVVAATPARADIANGVLAPDLTLTDAAGQTHHFADFKGKNVVLEWSNEGCPFVHKHYDSGNMQKLQADATKDDKTVWLTIYSSAPGNQGHVDGAQAIAWKEKTKAAMSYQILDAQGVLGQAFGAKTTPHMFVLDKDGKVAYQGAIDDDRSANPAATATAKNYVTAALTELESGKPVTIASTPAYGCSVKYSGG